ncbi:MAG: hypothetical protein KIT84_25645 [Labilithrix sp.]|nr:hypothetical protein [Labilithrix sp.]MCW5814437.1 hypothetical protein [Labilithrix sp.]
MAIVELAQEVFAASDAAAEGAGRVRVGVHDASRLEWSLSVPLPEPADGPAKYSLRVEMQIPSNAFVRHVPWDQMQAFTRLDGPAFAAVGDVVTIDALRRGALAMANQLARASDGFQRHCRLAGSLFATAPHSELEDALTIWIEASVRIAQESRERLTRGEDGEASELARERKLVDEYVSVRLLEMLAGAERGLSNVVESKSLHATRLAPVLAAVEGRLGEALGNELAYRAEHSFTVADPSSPHALEKYLDRASRLKKHFQEVLFLEQESFKTAERAYHWVAAIAAIIASTWAFAWQIALLQNATQNATATVSSGFVLLTILAGLVYATKDRFKEIGRDWMTRRVHRVWGAQRITRYRAPHRRLPTRDVVVSARESFTQNVNRVPDPLNPECGASTAVTVLTYEHNGEVLPNAQLVASGVRRVKHVFRYDLSPIFARLDDATKPVPVLDDTTRRVRFIDAPRCYRLPIRVEVQAGATKQIENATLVLHKRGLERLERDKDSNPSLSEVGLEPG